VPALTRYFVDEDTVFLGKALAAVREDVIYPGHVRCPIAPGEKDAVWAPKVGEAGWLLISRDKRILQRPVERMSLIDNGVRALSLTKSGNMDRWEQLRLVVRHWDRIEALTQDAGPFAYALTGIGVSKTPLRDPRKH
jgi:hypothetical protein